MLTTWLIGLATQQVLQNNPSVTTELPPRKVRLERIVQTGDPAPDGNGIYEFALLPPVISDGGVVAFTAFFSATAADDLDNEMVLFAAGSAPSIAVREGDPAPNGVGTYGSHFPGVVPPFWWPSIDAQGEIAVSAGILSPLFDDECVLRIPTNVSTALAPQSVVRSGELLPNGNVVGHLLGNLLPINQHGEIAFVLNEYDGTPAVTPGLWSGGSSGLEHYFTVGDSIATLAGTVSAWPPSKVDLGDDGVAIALAELAAQQSGTTTGVVTGSPFELAMPISTGQSVAPNLVVSGLASDVVRNASGDLAMLVDLTPQAPPFLFASGVLLVREGVATLVCKTGDPAPDGRGQMESFLPPQLSAAGVVVIPVIYASDAGFATDVGLLRATANGVASLLRTGDVLESGDVVGTAIYPAQVNRHGVVAVTAGIAPAFPYPDKVSLLVIAGHGRVHEVLRAGSELGGRRVQFVNLPIVPSLNGHRALNDQGQVAAEVLFSDFTTAIYRVTLPKW